MMRNRLLLLLVAASALTVAIPLALHEAAGVVAGARTPTVAIVTVGTGSVTDDVMAEGQIVPFTVSNVAGLPSYSAQVDQVFVDHGDHVKKGQILATLDPLEQGDLVNEADAAAAASQAAFRLVLKPHRPEEIEQARAKMVEAQKAYDLVLHPHRPQEIQAQADKVESDRQAMLAAQAQLELLQHGNRPQQIVEAEAAVTTAKAQARYAQETLNRDTILYQRSLIARADLDKDQTDAAIAQAALTSAKQSLSLMQAGFRTEQIDSQKATVAQARSLYESDEQTLTVMELGSRPEAIQQAKANLDWAALQYQITLKGSRKEQIKQAAATMENLQYAAVHQQHIYGHRFVRAPIDGVVIARNINPGEIATPGAVHTDDMNPTKDTNKELFEIADDRVLEFQAAVDQKFFGSVHIGQPADVEVEAYPGQSFRGIVTQINPNIESDRLNPGRAVINPTSPLTFSVWVRVTNTAHKLVPGQIGLIRLHRVRTGLIIPESALASFTLGEGIVYVEDSGVIHARSITYDGNTNANIRVLSGLKAGEHVVVSNTLNLRDGMTVNAQQATGAPNGEAF
ncbi:MAG: efflux RND transporter periplasmic adaptor subunit [Armatimonadetes bacterium]|nr:efflux RND transporter periplasmic adaptor subunit [Armatimonadota bacterium]MDE2206892.1 efflux RND transporter periplasmic adaptor subunit [Armatimonadota bacterium]